MQENQHAFIVIDTRTGEYLDQHCEWSPLQWDQPGPSTPYLYPTETDAESGIADILDAWDCTYQTTVPSADRFKIRKVVPSGWEFPWWEKG